jgi:uncharacterized protein
VIVFRSAFASLALLLISACSVQPDPAAIVSRIDGKPALWKVSAKDTGIGTAYLFGTVHVLPPKTKWQGPVLDGAIRDANGLVIEVTGLDDSAAVSQVFTNMGIAHGLPPLSSRVAPSLRAKLAAASDPVSGPPAMLDGLETWAAALTIGASSDGGLGLDTNSGVEHILQLRFNADSKPVSGLENVTQQFGYFDSLPEAEQRVILSAVVKDMDHSRADFQKLLDAWLRGDSDGLLATDDDMLASPKIRAVLLDERNRNWSAQIAAMIDQGSKPFVAVGAGHLAGPGGVPALLKAMGYKVERIQ